RSAETPPCHQRAERSSAPLQACFFHSLELNHGHPLTLTLLAEDDVPIEHLGDKRRRRVAMVSEEACLQALPPARALHQWMRRFVLGGKGEHYVESRALLGRGQNVFGREIFDANDAQRLADVAEKGLRDLT